MKNQNLTKNEAIYDFIIEEVLIKPVSDIIKKLRNRDFRDCDIDYLDGKLMDYTSFACEMLKISASLDDIDDEINGAIMNDYMANLYISRFETLLKYFETI